MQQYQNFMQGLLETGSRRTPDHGTPTVGKFGTQMRFNLQEGLPLITSREIHLKSVIYELLWLLNGSTNNNELKENGVSIWNNWAHADGSLPHVYGENWVRWPDTRIIPESELDTYVESGWQFCGMLDTTGAGVAVDHRDMVTKQLPGQPQAVVYREINQLQRILDTIQKDPHSRRMLLTGLNPATVEEAALPPCHTLYQFYVDNNGCLSCQLYQR